MELSRSPFVDGCSSMQSSSCRPAVAVAAASLLKVWFDTGCLVIGNVADCIVGEPPADNGVAAATAAAPTVLCCCPSGN